MSRNIYVFGDVKNRGCVEIEDQETLSEILERHAHGMTEKNRLKLIQVGGPLGELILANDAGRSIESFYSGMDADTIVFMGGLTCTVDFARFCTRYVIRELGVKNENIEGINEIIERIAGGDSKLEDMNELEKLAEGSSDNYLESRLKSIIAYLIENFRGEFKDHIEKKRCEAGICRKLFEAQCINACPAQVNVPGYVALMAEDKADQAYSLMRRNNPLPFICGMVCARPCESRCRRGEIEKTVGVRALKRYAAERTLSSGDYHEKQRQKNGKKVAVVGAGPAGLSAAYYLAKTGYEVTVYEKRGVRGGMLALGIPEYRLPQEIIDKEAKLVENMGVKIMTNTAVGVDIELGKIRRENDCVLLSTGAHIGNSFGPKSEGIEAAIDLLREVKTLGRRKIGSNVLVLGGGDVAMDAARTAVRLGASNVTVASIEEFGQMPASDEEKSEAMEEGVRFLSGYGTGEIDVQDGKVIGISMKKCIEIFDGEGRFNPKYNEAEKLKMEIDALIFAIGQRPDVSYLDEDIQTDLRGWIKVDEDTMQTSAEDVFAAGDAYRPGIAVKAIAEAKKAAESIDSYLGGEGLYLGEDIEIPQKQLQNDIWFEEKRFEKLKRVSERISNFDSVSLTISDLEAKQEAKRCLRCDRNTRCS